MTGLGSTNYTVAPNGTGSPRTGTLTVAGQIVTITQSTDSCSYSVSPTSMAAPLTGPDRDLGQSRVRAARGRRQARSPGSRLPAAPSMSGLGSANFTVAATTSPRTGTLTVAGQIISITQGTAQPPQSPVNLRIIRIVY